MLYSGLASLLLPFDGFDIRFYLSLANLYNLKSKKPYSLQKYINTMRCTVGIGCVYYKYI